MERFLAIPQHILSRSVALSTLASVDSSHNSDQNCCMERYYTRHPSRAITLSEFHQNSSVWTYADFDVQE
ncbi:uncharacterized protein PHALS_15283 [Plasmopara halstedii]|uniref:Uncharacterized protein n=1 Tax=Plasmopara halstedii TaxID=4781 RepID=A0A0P1AC40_PLAHL|nr:uncharacterized protein PHALS_15283 [Plasmopara halstedii]CEG38055.1 hypothetical protein PHALS_15283 [Plasmopara halstedii]|eukprot:XP_024574424.1 hypothetical protein PHALS_15283 [Plasmopara halstedii]